MKKGILIVLGMFMVVSTAEANIGEKLTSKIGVKYSYNDAVTFNERGVEFYVFLNGDFDFNANTTSGYYDYNGYRTKRGVRIDRDFNGRVRRIGNVFVNYDSRGNVKRIGNVYMRYRRGALTRVGNLKIKYNRWGDPFFYGRVKYNDYYYNGNGVNFNINIGDICDYNDNYFYRSDFRNNYRLLREDNDFYYYRAQPNAKIGKRSKVLKRRKANSSFYKNKKLKKRKNYKKDDDGIYSNDKNYRKKSTRKSKRR